MTKVRIFITYKQSVFDPQGETITEAVHSLGHDEVKEIKVGKFFDVTIDSKEKEVEESVIDHENLNKYKVLLPKSNGSGAIGEVLSTPLIGEPLIGHTQTFISIGAFDKKIEAENVMKYIKTKFARTLLGVLKITQDNPPTKWKYVPLQDFTSNSDIDWTKSIHEIDEQLYRKYNLSKDEIEFIETKVKEMN